MSNNFFRLKFGDLFLFTEHLFRKKCESTEKLFDRFFNRKYQKPNRIFFSSILIDLFLSRLTLVELKCCRLIFVNQKF